jgi:plastocyanin
VSRDVNDAPGRAESRYPAQERGGFGWRRLAVVAGIAVLASLVIPMLIQLSFEPFIVAMAAPVAVGVLLFVRWPRVGAIWLGVVSLALLVFSAPFLVEAMLHPEALSDFIPLTVFTVGLVVAVVATIPAFREGPRAAPGGSAPRIIVVVAALAVVAAAVVSVVAAASIQSVEAQEGDILLVTEDIAFRQDQITVEEGQVAIHVDNLDSTRHTFTIDQLDVDLDVPPNSSQRTTFSAPPGTYVFYCRPHTPGMEGVLVVT